VEGFRVELARSLPGRRVRRVEVRDAGVLHNTGDYMPRGRIGGRTSVWCPRCQRN
jgi:formamidopyrimidine-DNA glycosylase